MAPWSAAPVSTRPRIGPAQGAQSRPVATPRTSALAAVGAAAGLAGSVQQAVAEIDDRLGDEACDTRRKKADAEDGKQGQRGKAAIFIGVDRPAAANGGKCGYQREGGGHPDQHGQRAAHEWLSGAGEDEGQDGKDAGAEYGQRPSEIGNDKKRHHRFL